MKIFILLAALLIPQPSASGAERISFGSLAAGESVLVRFASSGCFHHSLEEFEFSRGEALTVEIFRISRSEEDKPAERKALGKITLTAKETAGLDKLLDYYRKGNDGGCTTQDEIALTLTSGGAAKISENYVDGSCGTWEEKNLTLFSSLVKRVEGR